jgi:hypothetical protein
MKEQIRQDGIRPRRLKEVILYLKGIAHGKKALAKRTADGSWTSPLIISENEKTQQVNLSEWQGAEAAAAKFFISVAGKEERIRLLSERINNREALDRLIADMNTSVAEDHATISEIENLCRIRCERRLCILKSNLEIYWSGVLKRHPQRNELPAEISMGADTGEFTYRARHYADASLEMLLP